MFLPPPCVSIQIGAPPAAMYVAILEERCDAILGRGSCHVEAEATAARRTPVCWTATLNPTGGAPVSATIVLRDPANRDDRQVQHSVAFRPDDAPTDRWATLGLLIAALVTVEQGSTATEPGSARGTAPELTPPGGRGGDVPQVVAQPLRATAPRATRAWDVRAAGLVALGQLPGVAWGTRVEASMGRDRLAVVARIAYLPPRTGTSAVNAQLGGEFQRLASGAGGCWRSDPAERLSARLCAGGDLNLTLARGFGVAEPASTSAVSGAAWAGATAQMRVHRYAGLVAGIEGAWAILRPSFAIEGASRVYSQPLVGGYASLGLAVSPP